DQLAGGARLGGGVGDALGEHLVVVDGASLLRDLAGVHQRALEQELGGSEQGAGVVEGRGGGIGHEGSPCEFAWVGQGARSLAKRRSRGGPKSDGAARTCSSAERLATQEPEQLADDRG